MPEFEYQGLSWIIREIYEERKLDLPDDDELAAADLLTRIENPLFELEIIRRTLTEIIDFLYDPRVKITIDKNVIENELLVDLGLVIISLRDFYDKYTEFQDRYPDNAKGIRDAEEVLTEAQNQLIRVWELLDFKGKPNWTPKRLKALDECKANVFHAIELLEISDDD